MRQILPPTIAALFLMACGSPPPAESPQNSASSSETSTSSGDATPAPSGDSAAGENEFQLNDSDSAASAQGVSESKIKPSATEAAMKFFVVDKDKGPIQGVVISLTSPDGKTYYTGESDAKGYAEVLVPVGKKYELVYLSLGRRNISAQVPVPDEANQNIKLTLRYKNNIPKRPPAPEGGGDGVDSVPAGFVLNGVTFDTGKATIKEESYPRLDSVLEYMTHKKSARIEISGHTDNVGNAKNNKKLSEKRAQSCKEYLISKGIEADRIDAVGFGDEVPVASNKTEEGRQRNRRIEAREL